MSSSPQKDVHVPSCLSKETTPTHLTTICGELLSYPQDRIWHSSVLGGTILLVEALGVAAKTKTSLVPWIGPPKLLIVVNHFTSYFTIGINWSSCRKINIQKLKAKSHREHHIHMYAVHYINVLECDIFLHVYTYLNHW